MKKPTAFLLTILGMLAGFAAFAQEAKMVRPDQTPHYRLVVN
ncbi:MULTISPECIES: hypothetical protein [unclassified Imperialibacter]|nr:MULTISPECIES: hypothetical protein [unclassified Imperialibacter]